MTNSGKVSVFLGCGLELRRFSPTLDDQFEQACDYAREVSMHHVSSMAAVVSGTDGPMRKGGGLPPGLTVLAWYVNGRLA